MASLSFIGITLVLVAADRRWLLKLSLCSGRGLERLVLQMAIDAASAQTSAPTGVRVTWTLQTLCANQTLQTSAREFALRCTCLMHSSLRRTEHCT